jgi:hypothetical protein
VAHPSSPLSWAKLEAMTDLLSRSGSTATQDSPPRPLPVAGALAGLATAGITLAICMAVAVIGWFLADAGAHGETTDALRIGADAWLLGHGSDVLAAGSPIGITPLGLTAVLALVGFRCGRWAGSDTQPVEATQQGRTSRQVKDGHRFKDDGPLGIAVAVCAGVYVVATILVAELCTHADATPSIPRAVLGALLISVLACGLGLAAGTGRLGVWWDLVPGYARSVAHGALTGALVLFAAAAVLVVVSLLMSFNEAANVFSSLGLSVGDALMMVLVSALVAPNVALLGVSYLAGPGFAVGTGTSVTATSVTLGAVPAFPLLAALPSDGPAPGWVAVLMVVPPVCALVGAGIAQHHYAVPSWDSAALRGFGSGLGAGLLIWLLVGLAGGPMGTGRMADIGAPMGELLVTTVGGMSMGGLLGGLAVTAWQRRGRRAK